METFLTAVPAFLFALGVIVFVHEFGHHVVAKLFGVRVLTFSLGFGKRLWGFTHRGTDYRISLIPLGGYVRMSGELPGEQSQDPGEFLNKPRWQRILVYLAGPLMNVVLSVGLIAAVFMVGIPLQALQGIPPVVGVVEPGSAGALAGLLPGDQITSIDGKRVELWNDAAFIFASSPERPLRLELLRETEQITAVITPTKIERYEFGETGLYPKMLLRISSVIAGGPAEHAGFLPGDEVLKVDGRSIEDGEEFVKAIENRAGEPVAVLVRRQGTPQTLSVTPQAGHPADAAGNRCGT